MFLRFMMHRLPFASGAWPENWLKDVSPESGFGRVIERDDLPMFTRIIVLVEDHTREERAPAFVYLWVIGCAGNGACVLLGRAEERVQRDWVGKIVSLYETFHADYVLVTPKGSELHLALKLLNLRVKLTNDIHLAFGFEK